MEWTVIASNFFFLGVLNVEEIPHNEKSVQMTALILDSIPTNYLSKSWNLCTTQPMQARN